MRYVGWLSKLALFFYLISPIQADAACEKEVNLALPGAPGTATQLLMTCVASCAANPNTANVCTSCVTSCLAQMPPMQTGGDQFAGAQHY